MNDQTNRITLSGSYTFVGWIRTGLELFRSTSGARPSPSGNEGHIRERGRTTLYGNGLGGSEGTAVRVRSSEASSHSANGSENDYSEPVAVSESVFNGYFSSLFDRELKFKLEKYVDSDGRKRNRWVSKSNWRERLGVGQFDEHASKQTDEQREFIDEQHRKFHELLECYGWKSNSIICGLCTKQRQRRQ
jgi:hypothetical protein